MRLSLLGPIDRWLVPPPDPAETGWIGNTAFAHRGLHAAGAPENSPAAFAGAIDRKLGIECDVQQAGDGEAVVFHDWELDRLTGERGPVARRSAAELGTIHLTGSSDCIPTLRETLAQVAGRVPLMIELKSRKGMRISRLCRAVYSALDGYRGKHAVMSFDPRVSRWFADCSARTVRGLVVTEANDKGLRGAVRRRLSLWHARPHFLAYDVRDLPSGFAAAQRARGLPVATWTVRSAEQAGIARLHADAPIAEGPGIEALA